MNILKRVVWLLAVTVAIVGVNWGMTQRADAATGCHYTQNNALLGNVHGPYNGTYWTSPIAVPSWSACKDINGAWPNVDGISTGETHCVWVLAKRANAPYQPLSGTQIWCPGEVNVISFNVPNGTRYYLDLAPVAGHGVPSIWTFD